jgi:hypothetical protein
MIVSAIHGNSEINPAKPYSALDTPTFIKCIILPFYEKVLEWVYLRMYS